MCVYVKIDLNIGKLKELSSAGGKRVKFGNVCPLKICCVIREGWEGLENCAGSKKLREN